MEIFVINIDKDTDRMDFARKQADNFGYNIRRISAICGRNLTKEEWRQNVNRWRFILRMGRKPMLGEIGCALSHIGIYKKMVQENIPMACIFEDDIIVLDGFKKHLDALSHWLKPNKPHVVRLNYGTEEKNGDCPVIPNTNNTASACAYCITLAGAKAILKDNFPIKMVADSWEKWVSLGLIELYDSNPKVCWHNNNASGFTSVIVREDKNTIDWNSLPRRIIRKILKSIGAIVDYILK